MRNVFMTTVAAVLFAGTAFAETENVVVPTPVLSGEVSLDFAETTNDNYGGTMSLDLGVDVPGAGTVDLDFTATDGNALTLDTWAVGTTVGGIGLAFGDDLGLFPGAEGEHTLAAPAMAEAAKVTVGNAALAVGFTDWTADITDISNIQGAYTLSMDSFSLTAVGDYNLDTENTVLGANVDGLAVGPATLGAAVTYDVDAESFGYEGVVGVMGATAYVNGDDTDAFQNVGGEYVYGVAAGVELSAGANYNIDTEDFAPTAGISFNF